MDGGGGELGMRVRITPVIDRGKLNGEAKKVEGVLAKKLKIGAGGNLAGLLKGGGGTGNAAVAGAVGGVFASAMQGLMGIAKKMLSTFVDASPMLKGILKMLNMGFMQILRPIGDTLAIMLRPIAIFFRLIGREIMKRVRDKRKELKAQGLTGMDLGMALMAEIPGIYLDVFMEFLSKVDWVGIFTKIGNFVYTFVTEKLPVILGKMYELGSTLFWMIVEAIGKMPILATLGGVLLGMIILAVGAMVVLGTLGMVLFTSIMTAVGPMAVLNGLGDAVNGRIMTSIGSMTVLGGLGAAILAIAIGAVAMYASSPQAQKDYDRIVGAQPMPAGAPPLEPAGQAKVGYIDVGKPGSRWQKPFEDIYNSLGMKGPLIPGLATGGEVLKTGWVNMHAGEVAADKGDLLSSIKEAVSSSGGGNVTVVIPGSAIANAIDNRIDYYYRTKVANRR